jgi:hypothetical protein
VREHKIRRHKRNQIGCGLLGLTESFSNYIPSIFKKPENIGFDRLGNKNLRAHLRRSPNNSSSLILLLPLAMDFYAQLSFLRSPLKIQETGVQETGDRGPGFCPVGSGVSGFHQPNTPAAK